MKNDYPKEFSIRNKASPVNVWSIFKPFSKESKKEIFNNNIDGLKLKFKHTTLFINGRHNSKQHE